MCASMAVNNTSYSMKTVYKDGAVMCSPVTRQSKSNGNLKMDA